MHYVQEQKLSALSQNVFAGQDGALQIFLNEVGVQADVPSVKRKLSAAEAEARDGRGSDGEFTTGPTRQFLEACINARKAHPDVALHVTDELSVEP